MKPLSIFRRLLASIIAIIIAFLSSIVLFFIFSLFSPYSLPYMGSYIGLINCPQSEVIGITTFSSQTSVAEIVTGEIWAIVIYVLSLSLPMFISESQCSATLGIKFMGGITINEYDNPITKSESIKRLFARIIYYPAIFIFFTNGMDIRPTYAAMFIFIVSIIFNVIEKLTSTNTIQKQTR